MLDIYVELDKNIGVFFYV